MYSYFIICFVTLLNSIVIESSFRCDYKYIKSRNVWIKMSRVSATWQDARLRCALEGAILDTPNDTETYNLRPTTNYWIWSDVHATFSKGDYYTIDGTPTSEISMNLWNAWSNKDNKEQCMIVNRSSGKMILQTTSCNFNRSYVCIRYGNEKHKIDECGTHDTEYHYYEKTGKCYKFHTVARNFSRAYFTCSAEGGHLAIINSEVEHTALVDLFKKYPGTMSLGKHRKDLAFIGFHAWGNWFDWRTIHDQTLDEAGYSKFVPGEPNYYLGRAEYCGTMYRTGMLNDYECHEPIAFICEKSPEFPGVCDGEESEN